MLFPWQSHPYLLAEELPIFVCHQAVLWKHVVKLLNHCKQTEVSDSNFPCLNVQLKVKAETAKHVRSRREGLSSVSIEECHLCAISAARPRLPHKSRPALPEVPSCPARIFGGVKRFRGHAALTRRSRPELRPPRRSPSPAPSASPGAAPRPPAQPGHPRGGGPALTVVAELLFDLLEVGAPDNAHLHLLTQPLQELCHFRRDFLRSKMRRRTKRQPSPEPQARAATAPRTALHSREHSPVHGRCPPGRHRRGARAPGTARPASEDRAQP